MRYEKILTKEIAEQFRKKKIEVQLDEFTAIEDAAAESLSKHEDYLNLDGLTSLSDAAAESLSKHEGTLSLHGLTSLSDATAAIPLPRFTKPPSLPMRRRLTPIPMATYS